MAIVIKSKGSGFLTSMGVPENLIDAMNAQGVKLVMGYKDYSFVDKDGKSLSVGELPVPVSELVLLKDVISLKHKELAKVLLVKSLSAAINYAAIKSEVKAKWPTPPGEGTVSPEKGIGDLAKEQVSPQLAKGLQVIADLHAQTEQTKKAVEAMDTAAKEFQKATVALQPQPKAKPEVAGVISLKDATQLYQRVHGSSAGSVYVVAAVSGNIKIAARIKGDSLSVRVEGIFTPTIIKALEAQGVANKNGYASGHFECGHVPPERVVGAILVGCGLPFDTPIPDMKKIKSLGK